MKWSKHKYKHHLICLEEAGLAARIQAFASVSFGVGLSLNMIPQDLKIKS